MSITPSSHRFSFMFHRRDIQFVIKGRKTVYLLRAREILRFLLEKCELIIRTVADELYLLFPNDTRGSDFITSLWRWSFHLRPFDGRLVCQQHETKTAEWISMKLGWTCFSVSLSKASMMAEFYLLQHVSCKMVSDRTTWQTWQHLRRTADIIVPTWCSLTLHGQQDRAC